MATQETKVALILILAASIILASYIYDYYLELLKLDILAVSKIYIESTPSAYEDPSTHEWKGSYWVVLATTTTRKKILSYKFNKSETEQPYADNTVNGKTLIPQATITVTIEALQPYWSIPLKKVTYEVFPKTYGMWMNKFWMQPNKMTDVYVEPFTVEVWEFAGSWKHHAPFKITVEKRGDYYWKTEKTIDLVGASATIPITLTSPQGETLIIQLQGLLNTGYGQPLWDDLIIFSKEWVFKGSEYLRNIIRYDAHDLSYSNYWFGGGNVYKAHRDPFNGYYYEEWSWRVRRWADDGSPAHYFYDEYDYLPVVGFNFPVWGDEFPGVYRADTLTDYIVKPLRPKDAFTVGVNTNPPAKSLVEYLASLPDIDTVDLNELYGKDFEITTDNRLVIWQPIGAVSWLFTLKISTELADTIVYQPVVGNGKIVSTRWLSSGTGYTKIGGKDVAYVTVKQLGTGRSRLTVTATTSTSKISITPSSDSVILDPNEEYTFAFTVENLGVSTETAGEITFKVYNDLGTETDSSKMAFTLLPTGVGDTILTVYTVDAETKTKVSGIYVIIQYGSETDAKATVDGAATFNLGSYQGTVQISTAETAKYNSASKSVNVQSGYNTAIIELSQKEEPEPIPWYLEYWWLLVILFSAIASILAVVAVARR